MPGVEGVKAIADPMATSIRDTQLFLKEVVKAGPWKVDSGVNRTVWQGLEVPGRENVTIGFIEDDGVFTPHPPVRRAMREAVEKLEKAGIKVVPIELPNVARHNDGLWKFFAAAGSSVSTSMALSTLTLMQSLADEGNVGCDWGALCNVR